MSQRLTVANLKADSSRIAAAVNVEPADPRFLAWANEFEERASNQGRWFGSITETQFCVDYQGCFSIPREIAYLERIAINGSPIIQENAWFPFTRLLASVRQCDSASGVSTGATGCCTNRNACYLKMITKAGTMASYAVTLGANKVLRVYPTDAVDVGKTITFEGYDKNKIWTTETVTMAVPFRDTVAEWDSGSPLGVKKDVTVGRVLVYEYDKVTGIEVDLASYQPGETHPSYRIGYIPGLGTSEPCGCTTGSQGRRTLTALASLQHVELVSDGDWLLFQNLPAYKAGMIAMKAYEEGNVAKGDEYFYGTVGAARNARGVTRVVNRGGAIPLLNAELRKMSGDRVNAYVTGDVSEKQVRQMVGFW